MNNNDNGFITKIWGPHFWKTMHFISFSYPNNPTIEDKKYYKQFFESLCHVLPCSYCRVSCEYFISTEPTKLTDEVLTNRETITKWLYLLHERVNQKLGVEYNVTYDEVVDKYESFRAICVPNMPGCIMPADLKAKSYQNDSSKDCPIISKTIAMAISEYAEKRGIKFDKLDYYNNLKNIKNSKEWMERNEECKKIIYDMRNKGISSLEITGEYKGLPTKDELILISKLCTNMSKNELIKITELLDKPVKMEYRLKSFKI